MPTRFTRVTVLADERSLDVSLPADRPLLELLPQIRDLLSLSPHVAGSWALSTVSAGAIDQRRSLQEAGVIDADVLYLTPPKEAPAPPVVDDVVDEVQSTLDDDGSEWTGTARAYGCAALAGVALLVATVAALSLPLTVGGRTALLADLAVSAAIAGWLLRGRGGDFLVAAALPAWTLTGLELARLTGWPEPAPFTTALTTAAIGLAALALAGPRWYGFAAAGFAALPFGLLATGLAIGGLGAARTAAAGAVLAVFGVGIAPQFALGRSRLVGMVRAEENGTPVGREAIALAVSRGQATLSGAVAGISAVAAIAVTVLLTSGAWASVTLGAVLGTVFALRSRAFTRTGQVVPMLVPGVVAAAVTLIAVPALLGAGRAFATWLAFGGPIVLILVLVLAGRPRLDEVGAARLRQLFDIAELLAVLAIVPLAIATFGGFDWALG